MGPSDGDCSWREIKAKKALNGYQPEKVANYWKLLGQIRDKPNREYSPSEISRYREALEALAVNPDNFRSPEDERELVIYDQRCMIGRLLKGEGQLARVE